MVAAKVKLINLQCENYTLLNEELKHKIKIHAINLEIAKIDLELKKNEINNINQFI